MEQKLTSEELEAQVGSFLPDREALSMIQASFGSWIDNLAMPVNIASAVNNESSFSWAIADADQVVVLNQTSTD